MPGLSLSNCSSRQLSNHNKIFDINKSNHVLVSGQFWCNIFQHVPIVLFRNQNFLFTTHSMTSWMIHDHFSKWKVILQKILQTQWTASASINLLILKKQLLVTSWSKGYVLWWSCWRQRPRWCCRYQWYNAGQGRVRMMKICISSLEHCYCCLRIHYCSDADIPEPGSVTESCYCSIRDEFLIFFTSLRLSTKNFSIFSSGSGAVTS